MNQRLKVRDNPGLLRDRHSKAVINTDLAMLHEHRQKRQTVQSVAALNNDVNNLKQELGEIKELLIRLLNK